jgi:hypothetical protein
LNALIRRVCLLATTLRQAALAGEAITFAVGENNELPMADIRGWRRVGGILKAFSDEMALASDSLTNAISCERVMHLTSAGHRGDMAAC